MKVRFIHGESCETKFLHNFAVSHCVFVVRFWSYFGFAEEERIGTGTYNIIYQKSFSDLQAGGGRVFS